jgi:hypothetical protein
MGRSALSILVALACLSVLAWAPPLNRTVVHVRSEAVGLEFTVNGQSLGDESLEIVTLEHAIEDNPQMRIADIYENALIVVCIGEGVSARQRSEVHERLQFEGFGNIQVGQSHDCSYPN